jgi:predicted permease
MMPFLSTLRSILRAPFRGEDLDRELDEELESYLHLLIDEKIRAGMDPEHARREALIELGGAEQVKANVRETRHGAVLDTLINDTRFAFRTLRKSPGFAAVFVMTLAIGIGANTALFSTIKALLLSPLPYEDPDRLVASVKTYDGNEAGPVSRLDFLDYRRLCQSFENFCAVSFGARFAVTGGDRAEEIPGLWVSWDLFPMLGVSPILGRGFSKSDEEMAGARIVIISNDLWLRRFGGGEDVVGRSLLVNGEAHEVVGVMPQGFRFLRDADAWLVIDRDCPIDAQRDAHSFTAVGRLKNGTSFEQAQSDVDSVAAALAQGYPDTNTGKGLKLYDLREYMVAHVRPSLNLLVATTALLLLIACINVAGLQLARGQRRLSEMAMRSALGANRGRLIRQLLTESVILTLVAGAVGIAVAYLFHHLLLRLLPQGDPGVPIPTIDAAVMLFAVAISVATGLIVGIVPALRGTSINVWQKLETSTRSTEGRGGTRLRSALVVLQVAMSVVLLIGCVLLIRSMVNLVSVDLGYDTDSVLSATYVIQADDESTVAERVSRIANVIEEIESLPGITSAAAITKLPIASTGTDWPIWLASEPRPEPNESKMALARVATSGYFSTIGIPLLRGRDFTEADVEGATPAVIISEAVAQDLFPDREPIGQMVKLGWFDFAFEVIGVVGNAKINGIRSQFDEAMYLCSSQFGPSYQWLVVRTEQDPHLLVEPIRTLVEGLDASAVMGDLVTMSEIVDGNLSGIKVVSMALALLSLIALLLTAVGLYGVLAYNVSQRTNEIGIRFALGASPTDVTALIVKNGLVMVGAGIVLGFLGASLSTRLIENLVFEIEPLDPVAYLGGAVFFATVAATACLLPALRATRVDPATALHAE